MILEHSTGPGQHPVEQETPPGTLKDVVCGMTVDPQRAASRLEHLGHTYYFCNPACLEKFRANPARYTSRPAALAAFGSRPHSIDRPAISQSVYTCPM